MKSSVKIRFLGSGDAFSSGGRFNTCIYVEAQSSAFLIDCGASSLIAMKKAGISSASPDAIFVSHLHGDHFGGIPFLLLDAFHVSERKKPLVIAGPCGHEERIRIAQEALFPGSFMKTLPFSLDFSELEIGKTRDVCSVNVTAFPAQHPSGSPSLILRLECNGRTIAFSGDTEWTDSLVLASAGADLFICECNFLAGPIANHMDYETIKNHANELGCKRLVLTHMGEEVLKRTYEIEVECAVDGLEICI